jgi:uncharacterized HAD superfamily protein
MRIGVDIDGTITTGDAVRAALVAYAESTGIIPNLQSYDYGLSEDQMRDFLDLYIEQALESEAIQPMCSPMMMEWYRAGDDIYIITARDPRRHGLTTRWLSSNGVPYKTILHSDDKAFMATMLGLDCMIEDNGSHALACACAGIPTLIIDAPYNQWVDTHHLLHRVHSWLDIASRVEGLRHERL